VFTLIAQEMYDEGLARNKCIKLYLVGKKSIFSWYFPNPLYTKMLINACFGAQVSHEKICKTNRI